MPGPPTVISVTSRIAVRALTPPPVSTAVGGDFCAGFFRREGVADPDRDAGSGDRAQRVGMQNFCAEVGQLGGFVVGNFWNRAGFRNQTRVGGLYAVYVGPDDGFLRASSAAPRMVAE